MLSVCQQTEKNVLIVPSKTDIDKTYVVNMIMSLCEYEIEVRGSPYPHKYVLWVHKLISSTNFLPAFSYYERKNFAKIAIGEIL